MPPTRSACSVCRHDAAAEINAALEVFSYRQISRHFGVSLAAISRHSKHRPREATQENEQPSLESRVGQLEGDVAMFRLLFGIGDAARRSWEEAAELECREDDGIPF